VPVAEGMIHNISNTRRKQGIQGIAPGRGPVSLATSKAQKRARPANWESSQTVRPEILIMFTRQLGAMYRAGVSIVRALEVLAYQVSNPEFQMVIFSLNSELLKGYSFSRALQHYPKIFNPLYISMIRIGEMEGDLSESLERVAEFLERDYNLRKRIKNAMTYPVAVFCFSLVMAFFIFNYILPNFVSIFEGLKIPLPLPTRVLILLTKVAQSPYFITGAPILITLYVMQLKKYLETPAGRYKFDELKLRLPVFGPIFKKVALARFSRALSTLLMAGINTITSLQLSGAACGNEVLVRNLMNANDAIKNGKLLSQYLRRHRNLYPRQMIDMIMAGEESGRLDDMLERLANYYDTEVEYALQSLAASLEPFLIFATGLVVAFIVVGVFLPLYGFLNNM
jgi:type IV pilus assembly protein PilC